MSGSKGCFRARMVKDQIDQTGLEGVCFNTIVKIPAVLSGYFKMYNKNYKFE